MLILWPQVPRKRSHVADFHDRLEADVLLQAKREVVDRWRVRVFLNRVYRGRSSDRGACQTGEIVDITKVDAERAVRRLIVDEIAASCATTNARRVIYARVNSDHRFALASQVPRKAETRFEVDRCGPSITGRGRWIDPECETVVGIAAAGNDRTNQASVRTHQRNQFTGDRIARATLGRRASGGRRKCDRACAGIQRDRLRWIKARGNKVGALAVDLLEWRVVAKAHAVVHRQPAIKLPLVCCVPLNLGESEICKRPRC